MTAKAGGDMKHVLTVCPYCGCGCGIYLQVEGDRITGAMPSFKHPVAQGRLCIRGWHAHELATSGKRITAPMVRRNGKLEPAAWPEALAAAAKGLAAAQGSPAAVGVLGSSRLTNEDNFALMRFARAALGTNNVDSASRAARNPALLGAPGFMTDAIADLRTCGAALVCGSDVAEQLPKAATEMLWGAWEGMPLVTVSPRADWVSRCADQALLARPGTEAMVIDGLTHLLVAEGDADREIADAVADATPAAVEQATGVTEADLRQAVSRLAGRPRVAVLYGTGVAQSLAAEATVAALARLARALNGPDSRPQFLSPDCNFQGACDMGIHPEYLSGYQPVADADVRQRFEKAWKATLPTAPGKDAAAMMADAKALLVMGDDPVVSLVSPSAAGRALDGLDFLCVIDSYLTETAARAHMLLPAAGFAEVEGTFTNAERRVQRLRAAVPPAGESRPAWQIICDLAKQMRSPMAYRSASAVMDEIASLTPLYADCSYAALDREWGWRWAAQPAAAPAAGKAAAGEAADAERPLLLAIDGTLYSWDTDVRPLAAPTLEREHTIRARDHRQGFLEMNPTDGVTAQVRSGQMVEVVSGHGSARLQAVFSEHIPTGTVLVPYQSREKVLALFGEADVGNGRLPLPCPVAVRRA
jgi:predicted molibdopterin-dependent oxidoreductase YjgC